MSRREKRIKIYAKLRHKNGGMVPCFVCGHHVKWIDATLEHIIPRSYGGTFRYENMSISHSKCNKERGAPLP